MPRKKSTPKRQPMNEFKITQMHQHDKLTANPKGSKVVKKKVKLVDNKRMR